MKKPNLLPELTPKDIGRFWSKVNITTIDKCWEWHRASPKAKSYPTFKIGGHTICAHRIAWFLYNRRQPGGFLICHHCDNPRCCNPHHLFLGSMGDNAKDMYQKGRGVNNSGERHGNAKLTTSDVLKIRELYTLGYSQYTIANEFKIHQGTVSRLVNLRRWHHL